MNIRNVHGIDSQQQLYELAASYQVHVSSMDALVRFAIDLQRRAIAQFVAADGPAVEIRVLGEME